MTDVVDKHNLDTTQRVTTQVPDKDADNKLNTRPSVGLLVEMIMILLLAGVIFIFVFGVREVRIKEQMKIEAKTLTEAAFPKFDEMIAKANELKKESETQLRAQFQGAAAGDVLLEGDWPQIIDQFNLPQDFNPKGFVFSYTEGQIIATTTDDFGRKDIKLVYDLEKQEYNIQDPDPDSDPKVEIEWLPVK